MSSMNDTVIEELSLALGRWNIDHDECEVKPCGHVCIAFRDTDAASAMLAAGVPEGGSGTLRDRACSGLISLTELMEEGATPDDPRAGAAFMAGWAWNVYPSMDGSSVTWHVSVDLPLDDAQTLTASLNLAYNRRAWLA